MRLSDFQVLSELGWGSHSRRAPLRVSTRAARALTSHSTASCTRAASLTAQSLR